MDFRLALPGFACLAISAFGCSPSAPAAAPADPTTPTTTKPEPAPDFANDPWALAEGDLDGHHSIVRVRIGLERFARDRAYPTRLEIAADFIRPFDDGMPQPDDARALGPIEDEIVQQFDVQHEGLLAAVVTGNVARTFIVMSKRANVGAMFAAVKAHAAGRALRFHVEPDPSWERFRALDSAVHHR